MSKLRRLLVLGCVVAALATTGCQSTMFEKWPTPAKIMHELKPHRLAHWNRGPDLGRDNTDF